jgi:nitroreductase
MHSFVTNGVSVLFDFCLTAGFTIRFDVIVLCNSFFHNEYISQCKDTISFLITIGLRYLCIHKSNENGNNMENFSELIKNRRSMRKFTDEELTQDEVVALMKAALMSPSSKRSNSWQFVVVDDKEKLKKLSHCKEQASSFIADAALAIVVMADPLASDVWIEDASIASIMIQLQAEDLGLGSCWVQVRERFTATGMPSDEFVHGILDIPLQLQILSVIAIGHKGMERKPFNEEHLQWEKIHINKFGGK